MSHIVHHWRAETPAGIERPLYDSSPDGLRRAEGQGLVLTPGTVCTSCHAAQLHPTVTEAQVWAGLHRCRPRGQQAGPAWTREEDDAIRAGGRDRDLAARFGRTIASVRRRRHRLRDGHTPTNPAWSQGELYILADNRHLTARQLIPLLPGRSRTAIAKRLTKARKELP